MIAFACGLMVVTCSWFGFNAIIVTHLLEIKFEFTNPPIVKDNKLRLWVVRQPGVIVPKGFNVVYPSVICYFHGFCSFHEIKMGKIEISPVIVAIIPIVT
jgi:hypothetical protein